MTDSGVERSVDQAIGKRVKSARGKTAQTAVAAEMKELGHKWSQATVWAIEKGDRALKLAEAQDLAMILGVSITDLIEDESDTFTWIWGEIAAAHRSQDDLMNALVEWSARRHRMYGIGKWLDESENIRQIPESKRESLHEVVLGANLTLKSIVDAVISEGWADGRLEELDEGDEDPVDFEIVADVDLLRDDWRQLPDPENEARVKEMMDQVFAKKEQGDGIDPEA